MEIGILDIFVIAVSCIVVVYLTVQSAKNDGVRMTAIKVAVVMVVAITFTYW